MRASFSPHCPEVHGHRGCRGLRPENTLPAFQHALALGVDVLEMDVVVSADLQVVVSHEPWLNAKFCSSPTGQSILPEQEGSHNFFQMPYAVIRQYECGLRPHPAFPEQVSQPACKPLLREVLFSAERACQQLGRAPVGYSIEIKCSPDGDHLFHPPPAQFLDLVLTEIHAAGVLARTTLLCFDERILRLAHQLMPALPTCFLLEAATPWVSRIQQLGFVPSTLGPDFVTVTPAAILAVRAAFPSLRLVPWTVNQPEDMKQLIALRVDGITTDYPDRLMPLVRMLA
jgi:glycerophosphoryl diester phosphodiesterase